MKEYPTISRVIQRDIDVYAFDKLDGSNIRVEWSKKRGFYKFGSRHCLIDSSHETLGESISLIQDSFVELDRIFRDQRYESAVAFFEFFGDNSCFGNHIKEPHRVILIDVAPYKKGILTPDKFLKLFDGLYIPNLVYRGRIGVEAENKIRNAEFDGITFEGVVCKGISKKGSSPITMFKVKTNNWIEKLRNHCDGDEKLFEKLV